MEDGRWGYFTKVRQLESYGVPLKPGRVMGPPLLRILCSKSTNCVGVISIIVTWVFKLALQQQLAV